MRVPAGLPMALFFLALFAVAPVRAETIEGKAFLFVVDELEQGRSFLRYMLETSDGSYALHGVKPYSIESGTAVRVTGKRIGKAVIAGAGGVEVVAGALPPGAAGYGKGYSGLYFSPASASFYGDPDFNLGEQTTLVLLGEYGNAPFPATAAAAERIVLGPYPSIGTFYEENSGGATWFSGDVVGPLYLGDERPPGQCPSGPTIFDDFIREADPLVDFTQYKRVMLVWNCFEGGIGGVGELGASEHQTPDGPVVQSWTYNRYTSPSLGGLLGIGSHELGHNFGAEHSNFLNCTASFGDDPSKCLNWEYGNLFAVMGGGMNPLRHFTANHKRQIGFFGEQDFVEAQPGIFTLSPLEASSGIRQLVVPYGYFTTSFLWGHANYSIEYRQPIGYDATAGPGVRHGVFVTLRTIQPLSPTEFYGRDHLIDTKLGTAPGLADPQLDAPLLAGEGYHDNNISKSFNVISTAPEGAVVEIVEDPEGCRRDFADVYIISKQPVGAIQPGQSVSYVINVSNDDLPACGASDFDISASGPQGWTIVANPASLSVPAGEGLTFALAVTSPASASDGWHSFSLSVQNRRHFYYNTSFSDAILVGTEIPFERPDLVVSDIEFTPLSPAPGTTVTFNITVRNVGVGQSGASTLRFYAEQENGPAYRDYYTPPLEAGGEAYVYAEYAYSADGTFSPAAHADFLDFASESDETNNVFSGSIQVYPLCGEGQVGEGGSCVCGGLLRDPGQWCCGGVSVRICPSTLDCSVQNPDYVCENPDTCEARCVLPPSAIPTVEAGGPFDGYPLWPIPIAGSATDTDGTIVSLSWDASANDCALEDESVSGLGTPAATDSAVLYCQTNGIKILSLNAVDDAGQQASDSSFARALARGGSGPPTVDARGPYTGVESSSISIAGYAADDGTISSMAWDLTASECKMVPGSEIVQGVGTPYSSYLANLTCSVGQHTLTLFVMDNAGLEGSDPATVSVSENTPPNAVAGGPYSGEVGEIITLDGSASTDDAGIAFFYWDDPGGVPADCILVDDDYFDALATVSCTLEHPLGFPVRLTVVDEGFLEDQDTTTVTVSENLPPTANAGGIYSGAVNAPISLDGSQSSDDHGIAAFVWEDPGNIPADCTLIDDDTSEPLAEISCTADHAEGFAILLTVIDAEGLEDSDQAQVLVSAEPENPPVAEAGGPYSGLVDTNITLNGSASTDDAGIVAYYWEDSGGVPADCTLVDENLSDAFADVSCTQAHSEAFSVRLTVFDEGDLADSDDALVSVNLPAPPGPPGGSPLLLPLLKNGGGGGGGGGGGVPLAPTPSPSPSASPTPEGQQQSASVIFIPVEPDDIEQAVRELPEGEEKVQMQEIVSQARDLEKKGRLAQAQVMWQKAREDIAVLLMKARQVKASYFYGLAGFFAIAIAGIAVYYSSTLHSKPLQAAGGLHAAELNKNGDAELEKTRKHLGELLQELKKQQEPP